jgi:hypothetical protein
VLEPEIGREGMMSDSCDDAIIERVVGGKAEDADGLDAHILIRGGVDDSRIGSVGDGAWQDVYRAAAGVGDANERNLDLLESAVEVEIEAGELAYTEFVVDFYARVDFFAASAVRFKTNSRFEQLNFCGKFGRGLCCGLFLEFLLDLDEAIFSAFFRRTLRQP